MQLFIIILAIVVFCMAFNIWFFTRRYKNRLANHKGQIMALKEKYNVDTDYLNREIVRLNYLISLKQNATSADQKTQSQNETTIASSAIDNSLLVEIISDKEKLEDEKRKFQEKNKKLWEQSIAVHKEKERIDKLKNEIEKRHKEVTDSIRYAKRIQNALIPSDKQLQACLPEFFVLWRPRDIVSGDFYWIKSYENKVIFVVADCTGHGVPGAFMSTLSIALLNEISSKIENLTANRILEELRILIKSSINQSDNTEEFYDGMDLALCIFDRENKKLEYSGAYNSLFLFRNNELTEYEATPNPISVFRKEIPFAKTEIDLFPGDIFYMYTDGYMDEFGGPSGKKFQKFRLKDLILQMNRDKASLPEQKLILENTMVQWLGEKKQIDDILVVGFRI